MDISVVIPLYNEAESLPELEAWIERVMKEHNFTYICKRRQYGQFMGSNRGFTAKESLYQSHQVPPQLRQITRTTLRFRACPGRCSHHHGCRPPGQSGRNPGTLPYDHGRRIRPRFRMEKETVRPVIQNDPDKAIQCHGPQILWHKQPARFQLRPEGLQKCRYQKYRSVQRYAPVYSIPGKDCRFP